MYLRYVVLPYTDLPALAPAVTHLRRNAVQVSGQALQARQVNAQVISFMVFSGDDFCLNGPLSAYNLKVLLGNGAKYLLTFFCQYLCLYKLSQISYIIQRVEFNLLLKKQAQKA